MIEYLYYVDTTQFKSSCSFSKVLEQADTEYMWNIVNLTSLTHMLSCG